MTIRIFVATRPVRKGKPDRSLNDSNKPHVSRRHHLYRENKGRLGQSKFSLHVRFSLLKECKDHLVRNPDLHHLKITEYKEKNQVGAIHHPRMIVAEPKADQEEVNKNFDFFFNKKSG
jgi:hypothetical protein